VASAIGPTANSRWEPTPGQCLGCGGRGGWWSAPEFRETCSRCAGTGWDPARNDQWFIDLVGPLQRPERSGGLSDDR
jgi:hypothetical protein